jgi:hypothetical protein
LKRKIIQKKIKIIGITKYNFASFLAGQRRLLAGHTIRNLGGVHRTHQAFFKDLLFSILGISPWFSPKSSKHYLSFKLNTLLFSLLLYYIIRLKHGFIQKNLFILLSIFHPYDTYPSIFVVLEH